MKRQNLFLSALFLPLLLLSSCGTSKRVAKQQPPQARHLTFLAVNDIHATIDNFPRLAFMVDSLRDIYPHLLLVSGGDNQTGGPINDQYSPKGLPIIELMNATGFDMTAVGNHEFDVGIETFKQHTHLANFDFLCANMGTPAEMDINVKPYKQLTMPNGLKVAIVSVLDLNPNMKPACHPAHVEQVTFTDPIATAHQYLYLKEQNDLLIFLTHFGFDNDVRMALSFPPSVVDLIIGGHSHTKVDTEQIHNGILITQAEAKLKYATLIKLTLHPDGTLQREWELLEVGNKGNAKPEIAAMVAEYNNNPYMNEVLAHNPYPLTSAEQVGYWMADALQATAGTDLALINFGGVRQPYLPAGNVTRKDVLTIDPFGNQVVTLTLTGHELKAFITALFHNDVKGIMFPSNGFKIAYTLSPDDDELRDLQILHADGTPIDMDQTYTVASNSYVVSTAIFQHAQPDITHTTTTAEGWVKWLQEEASTVPDYRQVVRTTTHH